MKKAALLIIGISTISFLMAQSLEIEGKAKINQMDTATAFAHQVAREPDGTLSMMTSSTPTYAIGDFAQGGVVFWVSASGEHGKVVNIYDIKDVPWSNITNSLIGTSAQSNINGAGNTVSIIMQSGHISSAARHCADLEYGGFSDWYLPSKDELNEVYASKNQINAAAVANGGEAFSFATRYWSSTEISSSVAWNQTFTNGTQYSNNSKSTSIYCVRAIRAF